jgi:hypothetical protein
METIFNTTFERIAYFPKLFFPIIPSTRSSVVVAR